MKQLVHRFWNSPTIMTWGNMLTSSLKLLVLTPLILVKYDVNEIAFWYLLLTINSFIIVIDFGFYPTFSRVVSFTYHGLESLANVDGQHKHSGDGKPNWPLMGKVYGTINTTYFFLGFVIVAVIFSFTYPPVSKIILKTSQQDSLWTAYALYAFSVFFGFIAKKFDALIIGTGNIVIINRWDIINNALNTFSSIAIVYFGLSLWILALNQLFFSLLLIARDIYIERSICNKKFRQFRIFSFDKDVFLWCWAPAWRSGILILCSTGLNQASGLIYANVSDTKRLAAYLLSLKLVTTVAAFSQAPFYSKLPKFSALRVKNQIDELSGVTSSAMNKSLFVLVAGLVGIFFLGDWGLDIINSKSTLVDYRILMLMSFVLFLERHHAMHSQIFVTTNKIPFYKPAIITAVINVSLIWVLLPKIDYLAFPVAQGISNLVINNWWCVMLSLKSINKHFIKYFKSSAFWPALLLVLASLIRIIIN